MQATLSPAESEITPFLLHKGSQSPSPFQEKGQLCYATWAARGRPPQLRLVATSYWAHTIPAHFKAKTKTLGVRGRRVNISISGKRKLELFIQI